jgi:lipopolysaccharide/colanic/teichoic acid biosynthesis glycosyltransferase
MEAVLRKRQSINIAKSDRTKHLSGSDVYETNVELFTRVCDIALSVTALVSLAPVLVTVAIIVYLQDGGSIFYSQDRIGRNGKKFKCYKFRSMLVDSAERLEKLLASDPDAREEWERDHKLKNDPRITKFGNFIRKTSLDEFPQLWNVIRGDMSLVGPRPIVNNEIVKYGSSFRYYKAVKPGITGMWQVSGRNNIDYVRRVAIDRKFVQSRSLFLYLYIIFATIPAVLAQKGSY